MTVKYKGYVCTDKTNRQIFDVKEDICNRRGRYRRFRAAFEGEVSVNITIEKL
jgi:hypothetical protein